MKSDLNGEKNRVTKNVVMEASGFFRRIQVTVASLSVNCLRVET